MAVKKVPEFTPEDVKTIRSLLHLTKSEFAQRLEVSATLIDKVERGEMPVSKKLSEKLNQVLHEGYFKKIIERINELGCKK